MQVKYLDLKTGKTQWDAGIGVYRCKHCGKVVGRFSDKAWVKSYCSKTGKDVHLMRVERKASDERGK